MILCLKSAIFRNIRKGVAQKKPVILSEQEKAAPPLRAERSCSDTVNVIIVRLSGYI